jgi:hypothetical protein
MPVPVPPRSARPGRAPRSSVALRRPLPAVAALGLVLLLAGCSGSSELTSSGAASSVPEPARAAGSASVATDSLGSSVEQKDASGGTAQYAVAPAAVAADRSIVVKADVAVRVDDVLRSTGSLGALAVKHDATVASQSTSAGSSTLPSDQPTNPDGTPVCPSTGCPTSYASSTTTLRLDNAEVDALLVDIATLGTVETATRTSDDVTADVADVGARVRNAQASVARIRALMAQATKIGDVVALEGELSKRQADLEALEARQRALADQTAQATVTVRLYGTSAPVATTEASTGFLAGLRSGWDAFTGFTAGALTVLGALVPWLLLLVPLALLVWVVARRRRETPNLVDQAG